MLQRIRAEECRQITSAVVIIQIVSLQAMCAMIGMIRVRGGKTYGIFLLMKLAWMMGQPWS